jgi:hypothetical protein
MTELRHVEMSVAPACAVDLSAAVSQAVARTMRLAALRREGAELMQLYATGNASDQEVRRYRTIRLTLGLHHSPARMPDLPAALDDVLRRRAELIVELMMGPEVAEPPVAS